MIPFDSLQQAIDYGQQQSPTPQEFCCLVVWPDFDPPMRFRMRVNVAEQTGVTIRGWA